MTHRRDVSEEFLAAASNTDIVATFKSAAEAAIRVGGRGRFVSELQAQLESAAIDLHTIALCIRAICTMHTGAFAAEDDVSKSKRFCKCFENWKNPITSSS
jgi:hypothetical protein